MHRSPCSKAALRQLHSRPSLRKAFLCACVLLAICIIMSATHGHGKLHHVVLDEQSVAAKATAAVTGAFVADCASLGLHWIYDQAKIAEIAKAEGGHATFLAPGVHAKYHAARRTGNASMYGETIAVLLRSLSRTRGENAFVPGAFLSKYNDCFGVGGSYQGYADKLSRSIVLSLLQLAEAQQKVMMTLATTVQDHKLKMAAFSSLKALVESTPRDELEAAVKQLAATANPTAAPEEVAKLWVAACGLAGDLDAWSGIVGDEPGVLAVIAPIVAARAGHANMLHEVMRAAKCLQTGESSDVLVPFASRVLEASILGVPLAAAVASNLVHLPQPYRASVESAVKAAEEEAALGATDMTAESLATAARLGLACPLPQSVPTALFIALRRGPGAAFEDVVSDNILAGGDSCGRALLAGALLGAQAGAVPEAMLVQVSEGLRDEVAKLAHGIHTPVHHGEASSDHVQVEPHHPAAHA